MMCRSLSSLPWQPSISVATIICCSCLPSPPIPSPPPRPITATTTIADVCILFNTQLVFAMERSPKKARRDAAPPSLVDICDSRQELAILRDEKARLVKKAAPYRAALAHEVWRRVAQLRNTQEQLDLVLTAELGVIQSKTTAELREMAFDSFVNLLEEYFNVHTGLQAARVEISTLLEGLNIGKSYPAFRETEEQVLAKFDEIAEWESRDAPDELAAHLGLALRDSGLFLDPNPLEIDAAMSAQIMMRDVHESLRHEIAFGTKLRVDVWKLRALLQEKLGACIKGIADMGVVLEMNARLIDYLRNERSLEAFLRTLPPCKCYICRELFTNGLTFCACSSAACDSCLCVLVANFCSPNYAGERGDCELRCASCKTGVYPLSRLRRRLDDESFEALVAVREDTKAAAAVEKARGAVSQPPGSKAQIELDGVCHPHGERSTR